MIAGMPSAHVRGVIALVALLGAGCAQQIVARREFAVTYACPASRVDVRRAEKRSASFTPLLVTGCGHTAELDCSFISLYPVATPDDVVCTERGTPAFEVGSQGPRGPVPRIP